MARIVHWGKYYSPDVGGIESVTCSLARGAAATGHDVAVVCFSKAKAGSGTMDGVRVIRAPYWAVLASQPIGGAYVRSALREARRADVIHLHTPNMLALLLAILSGKRSKLLVHWHSDVIEKGMLGKLLRPLERAVLKRADCIVCSSQAYAEGSDMLRAFLHKVTVIPYGVPDLARIRQAQIAPPSALAGPLHGPCIALAVGRLVPYKGFNVLVKAAAMLPDDVKVVIVGNGPLRAELQKLIVTLGLEEKVLLAGHLDDSALDALYRNATVFCLPSIHRSEAFGVVMAEAMTYGLPIVATQIAGSGVPWVNEHEATGLNTPVNDPSGLAAAIRAILDSPPARRAFARGSRSRYEALFCETAAVNAMLAQYSTLMAREKEPVRTARGGTAGQSRHRDVDQAGTDIK